MRLPTRLGASLLASTAALLALPLVGVPGTAPATASVPRTLVTPPVVASPVATSPGAASPVAVSPVAVPPVATRVDVVTLVTGDRVRLTTYPDGHRRTDLLPGSPHLGEPVTAVHTDRADYVVPQVPAAIRSRLDTSLFDVTALATMQGGAVPVDVEFAPGVSPHDLPGLQLDVASGRPSAAGGAVVDASYRPTTASVRLLAESSWHGVRRVWLPAGRAQEPVGLQDHTLTVHVNEAGGGPVAFGTLWLVDVDDSRLFNQPVDLVDGSAVIQVPEGNYSVFTSGDRTVIVVKPDFAVTADRTISLSLGDATVTPTETLPRYRRAAAKVTLTRVSETRGSLAYSMYGVGARLARVQPVAPPPHGLLWTAVSATLARADDDGGCSSTPGGVTPHGGGGGCVPVYRTLAGVEDYRPGVPADLAFHHTFGELAVVPQRLHANGAATDTWGTVSADAPFDVFAFDESLKVHSPSVRVVRLQASDTLTRYLSISVILPEHCCSLKEAYVWSSRHYPDPGPAPALEFAQSPVGPGQEAGYDHTSTGLTCSLCRSGDKLRGTLPLFGGAGSGLSGQLTRKSMGGWTLRLGSAVLDGGHYFIRPHVTLPPQKQRYTLTASSHPDVRLWRLSTTVTDTWGFTSQHGTSVVPLLMPSYVPPTSLAGSMPAGRTSYRLDFGNLGAADASVPAARVSLSTDDGDTWHAAHVTRLDRNSFMVSYANPEPVGDRAYVSLRVTGADAAGRSVQEVAIRAYRVVPTAG